MWSRRQFLNRSAVAAGGCLGVGQLTPAWWQQVAQAATAADTDRRLVVIELRGGNDGLNTVVPFADDAYYQARPTLGMDASTLVKLDDHLGFNPALKVWEPLWKAGQLAVIENCGYPLPNRSHFESMDIWHAGQVADISVSGWLGRAADEAAAGDLCYVGDGAVPRALSRRLQSVASLEHLGDLRLRSEVADSILAEAAGRDELTAAVAKRFTAARELSKQLPVGAPSPAPVLGSTSRPLSERLGVVRTLIEKDQPFRVYYTALDGFDTHAQQRNTHDALWRQTSQAVVAFLEGLKKQNLSDRVAVFLFSEFGRRVKENGSQGTDHGAAAPVFLIGEKVQGGVQGGVPNLTDLDNGDLCYQIDFRDVYAGLLRGWLGVDPSRVMECPAGGLSLFTA